MLCLASSDWHNGPGGLKPTVIEFFKTPADLHLGCGDLLDFTAHDYRDYIGSQTVEEIEYFARQGRFLCVPGNHDPRPLLERVLPKSYIAATDTLEADGVLYTHGDQWGGWWTFLQPFAAWYPGLYRWLQGLRPTPGKFNPSDPRKFNKLALAVQAQALLHALNTGKPVCLGHTHLPAEYEAHGRVWMVDCGKVEHYLWAEAIDGKLRQGGFR